MLMLVFIGPDLRQSTASDNEDEAEAEEIQLLGGNKVVPAPGLRASPSPVKSRSAGCVP